MDLVKWTADERVDIPDMQALSFLVLGEFRRMSRLLAGDTLRKIVRGFKVEPESPVSMRIRIRLDPTGTGVRGKALGAENLSSGYDYGQLIGDRDSYFDDEGQAQQILDLSAQPLGTYTIEMRFIFTDGANDNRVFWNNGTLSEFIAAVNTRRISGWEARYIAGAVGTGNEWIKLGQVVWDGVAIDAVDIVDYRDMLFEGQGPTFTQVTQSALTDFDRSVLRGDVSPASFADAIKALQRQVADIKGQNDTGTFDWFARTFSAMDPADSLGVQTKSLRTIDHVMYTIGDGLTDYGDFNGSTGLHTCLTMIAAQLASLPRRITIVLKSRSLGTPTFDLSATYALGDKRIKIIGGDGSGSLGKAHITCSTAAASNVLTWIEGGGIELENVLFVSPTNEVTMFNMGVASGRFVARNCIFYNLTARTRVYADLPSSHTIIENCRIGDLFEGGAGVWLFADAAITLSLTTPGRMVASTFLLGRIQLYRGTTGALTGRCYGFRISDCFISGALTTHAFSLGTLVGVGACAVAIENCDFTHAGDEDCIAILSGLSGSERVGTDWTIRNCRFNNVGLATHLTGAGTGTSAGTGWAINSSPDITAQNDNILIDGCRFTGETVDAGGIRASRTRNIRVRDCEWEACSHVAVAANTYTAILFRAPAAAFAMHAVIDNCTVKAWTAAMSRTRGITLQNVDDVKIINSTLRGDAAAADITGRTTADAAIWIDDCADVKIRGNTITRWNYGSTTSAAIYVGAGSLCERAHITDNSMEGNGGYAIHWIGAVATHGPHICHNAIQSEGDADNLGITLTSGAGITWVVNGNTIRLHTGAGQDAIFFDTMGGGVCMGNDTNADIRKTGATAIRGYNEAGQNLNSLNAYT